MRGWGLGLGRAMGLRSLWVSDLCERDIFTDLVAHHEAVVLVRIARRDEPREEHLRERAQVAARQVAQRLLEADAARHVLQDGAEPVHAVGSAERHARRLSVAQLGQHLLAEERREEREAPHALGRRCEEAAQLALVHHATHSRRPLESRHGAEQLRIDE
eukprot:scaffold22266_cov72-Phaeocystis_antarctica.AAC.3